MIANLQAVRVPPKSLYQMLSRALNTLEPQDWPEWCRDLCGNGGLLEKQLEINGDVLLLVPEGREPER